MLETGQNVYEELAALKPSDCEIRHHNFGADHMPCAAESTANILGCPHNPRAKNSLKKAVGDALLSNRLSKDECAGLLVEIDRVYSLIECLDEEKAAITSNGIDIARVREVDIEYNELVAGLESIRQRMLVVYGIHAAQKASQIGLNILMH